MTASKHMRPTLGELWQRIDDPCRAYACPEVERCAADQAACTSFAHYVKTGRTHPPEATFRRVGKREQIEMHDHPDPSHDIFVHTMRGECDE